MILRQKLTEAKEPSLVFFSALFFLMRNTIRCCISCILPCGALDVIRIVHSNGRVEEISGTIRACEIMKAYPKHVLKKPTSTSYSESDEDLLAPKIVIVPPDCELQRGKIYFLMPIPPPSDLPEKTRRSSSRKKRRSLSSSDELEIKRNISNNNASLMTEKLICSSSNDQYLSEILSEKQSASHSRERRRDRVAVWRPHLESICESPSNLY